jgi:hypothetical protein
LRAKPLRREASEAISPQVDKSRFWQQALLKEFEGGDKITEFVAGCFEAGPCLVEGAKEYARGIGDFVFIIFFDAVELCEIFRDTYSELLLIIVASEAAVEALFKQPGQIVIFGYKAGRRFDCVNVAVNSKLSPENPDELVGHSVQIFSVFTSEEVIDREDERRFLYVFGEVEIDLNVPAERY